MFILKILINNNSKNNKIIIIKSYKNSNEVTSLAIK